MKKIVPDRQTRAQLIQAVDLVLASEICRRSPATARLLSFFLGESLTGSDKITPYHIASAVLNVEEGFDAQSNSRVRVQCARLRKLVASYYEFEGRDDPWRVSLPPGTYELRLDAAQIDHSRIGQTIAVLPLQSAADDIELADGLTREIIHALAQCRELRVMAPDTMFEFRNRTAQPVAVGKSLAVNYVLDGWVSVTPDTLRVAIKLTDVYVGQVMWSANYHQDLSAICVEKILERVALEVMAVMVGPGGTIERLSRDKPGQFPSYMAVLKFYRYTESYTPESHQQAKAALLQAVKDSPAYAEAWACLGGIYCNEHMFGYSPEPDAPPPLDRALLASQRAVQLAPDCVMGNYGVALCYFYRGELELFLAAADRSLSLAPHRSDVSAVLGFHLAYAGQWERGLNLLDSARQRNLLHPGWYWYPYTANAYRQGDFTQARVYASRLNMPDFFWDWLFIAMIEGQLGNREKAGAAFTRALELNPALQTSVREIMANIFPDNALVAHFMEGLVKAGFVM